MRKVRVKVEVTNQLGLPQTDKPQYAVVDGEVPDDMDNDHVASYVYSLIHRFFLGWVMEDERKSNGSA